MKSITDWPSTIGNYFPRILAVLYLGALWVYVQRPEPYDMNANPRDIIMFPLVVYAIGGLIIALAYNWHVRRFFRAAYEETRHGLQRTFAVTPAPMPKPLMILGLAGLVLGLFAPSLGGLLVDVGAQPRQRPPTIAILLAAAAVSYVGYRALNWLLSRNAQRYREFAMIETDGQIVTTGNHRFAVAKIHRLVLRNHILDVEIASRRQLVVGGSGMGPALASGALAAGELLGGLIRSWGALTGELCYRLDLETGGRVYTLAGGLDQITAYGLLVDLSGAVGLRVSD